MADADHATPGPSPRRRWVPLAILVGVVITQFAWIWGTPPFRAVDEIDHVFRASSVALGDIRSTQLPVDGRGALSEVPPATVRAAQAQCRTLQYNGTSNCTPSATLPDGNVLIASSAAAYSPVFYAVVGTLARPWDGVTALYVMRGTASLIGAVLLAVAAWCLTTFSRTAWPVAGLVLGLTPMAVYTSMIPAPNSVELTAATLLWCALLAIQRASPHYHGRLFVAAGLCGAILGSVRSSGPLFVVAIVAFVTLLAPRRTWELVRRRPLAIAAVAGVTVVSTLYQVWWVVTQPPVSNLDNERPFDLGVIVGQAVLWVFQWIGAFPFRGTPASPLTYVACGIAFAVVIVECLRRGDRARWLALAVVATCLVLPLLYTLETFTEKGTFWQGRYALPLLMGAPLLAGLALDRPECDNRVAQQLVAVLGALGTSAAVIHVVHLELQRPASADDPHWHAPAAYAVVLLALVAAASFSRAMAWSAARPVGLPPPDSAATSSAERHGQDAHTDA
jgi:4-amino-4-deoxy-L-arabinose transferase-like glycosyltransferase